MSLRKAKKLLEQKKALQANIQQNQSEEEEEQVPQKQTNNMFAAFGGDDSDEDEKEIQQQKKGKKNEQKSEYKNEENKEQKKKKKKNRKKKVVDTATKQQVLQQQEDVEKMFKEAGLEYKKGNEETKEEMMQEDEWQGILTINQSKFNYEKELRRHFNDAAFEDKNDDPELTKKQQKMQKHLKKMMKKSVLSPGVKDPVFIREKFEMEREEDKIKFMPTKKYDHLQIQYEAIRNSNDINALIMFSQMNPQHVDSLYFIGEFLRLQGNYRDADNLIQKVIYIYQAAGSYDLNQFIKSNLVKKHIVYDIYSTSLFMALFKFMDILGKKGCFRSALEYNKFLLKINLQDPTACLLCMDYNSISSKSYQYLMSFVRNYSKYIGANNSTLYLLPNFIYSVSLAKFYLQSSDNKPEKQELLLEQNKIAEFIQFTDEHWERALHLSFKQNLEYFQKQCSQILLLRAILIYPNLIFQIAQKNQFAKQFMNHPSFKNNQSKPYKEILQHQFWENVPSSYSYYFLKLENVADSNGLDKVLEVYVERSKILWKSREIMLWVKGALGFVLNKIDEGAFNYQNFLEKLCLLNEQQSITIPFNLERYAKISKANFTDRVQQIDLANIQDNQQMRAPQNENRMNLQGNPIAQFFNSLLPWVNLPQERPEQFDPDMPDIHDD